MAAPRLGAIDLLLALAVVIIWGTNFVVVHEGLRNFPPLFFAGMRFLLASLPLLWFIRRPKLSILAVGIYGLLIGAGQCGLLVYALRGHISPGLASVLLQTQAFFTIGLAVLLARERVRAHSLVALAVCAGGVALVAFNMGQDASVTGILLVLGSALSWAGGNILVKRAGAIHMLALVVWSSLFAAPALLSASLLIEGRAAILASIEAATMPSWLTVIWQGVGNALFGYGVWNWLLSRHPAALIAPLTLMVPVVAMASSSWYLSEAMPVWKIAAALLILAGLAINMLWGGRATGPTPPANPK